MIQALLSQQINISFFSMPPMLPHIKSGKVKPIAVGSRQRAPQLPDVPTLAETYPGFEQISWFGILGPAGLPREVVARVHQEIVRTLRSQDVGGKLTEQGFEIVASNPEEFERWARNHSDTLGKVIRDNNLKPQ